MTEGAPLSELARLFLRLGTVAFGGPAAHIAMMEDEVVRRRGWLTREQFLDHLGAANLIPGPNSTELAIHIGHARAGWPGLVVAGVSFILPAMFIVGAIGWGYVKFGMLPDVAGLLRGVQPVVIAIVAQALWNLGRSAVKTIGLALLAVAAAAMLLAGIHELVVLVACGGAYALAALTTRSTIPRAIIAGTAGASAAAKAVAIRASAAGAVTAAAVPFDPMTLFLVFAKIGSVLFGSGYVLIAFLRADFVERLGWLSERQLVDAVAVGQITPGPVFTSATFVGYVLAGPVGAAIATAGIFLPAFVFVALSGPIVPRIRQSVAAGAALDGVNVGSLALMAIATWQLGRVALADPLTVAIAVISLFLLVRYRVNSAWLIAAGGFLGWLAKAG